MFKKVKRHKQVLNSYPDIIIKSIKIHLKQENICQRNTSVGAIDTGYHWEILTPSVLFNVVPGGQVYSLCLLSVGRSLKNIGRRM